MSNYYWIFEKVIDLLQLFLLSSVFLLIIINIKILKSLETAGSIIHKTVTKTFFAYKFYLFSPYLHHIPFSRKLGAGSKRDFDLVKGTGNVFIESNSVHSRFILILNALFSSETKIWFLFSVRIETRTYILLYLLYIYKCKEFNSIASMRWKTHGK